MAELKYISGRGSASWSQAQKRWVEIGWILNFWGLCSTLRLQQTQKRSADEFSLQSSNTFTRKWWPFPIAEWDLAREENPDGSKMEAWSFLLQMGLFAWWEKMSSRVLSLGSGLPPSSSCPDWLNGHVTYGVTHVLCSERPRSWFSTLLSLSSES